jgi:RNA polymerase sigma-70 factor (ECF subfamily)
VAGEDVLENVAKARKTADWVEEDALEGPDGPDQPRPRTPSAAGEATAAAGSEEELLESCRRGDVAAFERLYGMHGERMKSVALNLLRRESDAEDAVQETFLKVYRGAASFRGGAALSTWIYRILVNTCYDLLRRKKRRPEDALEPVSGGEHPAAGSAADDHPLRLAIEQSLGRLAPRQKTVFLLAAVEGFSHREIAQIMDVSEGASRTLLFEAKRRLQELLGDSAAATGDRAS